MGGALNVGVEVEVATGCSVGAAVTVADGVGVAAEPGVTGGAVGESGAGGVAKGARVSVAEAVASGVSLTNTMGVEVCTVGHALAVALGEEGGGVNVSAGRGVNEAVSVAVEVMGSGEGNTPAMGVGRVHAARAPSTPNIITNRNGWVTAMNCRSRRVSVQLACHSRGHASPDPHR